MTETIFIDPGHGGHDPGAVGFDGLKEADVALDISLRISDKLRLFEIEPVLSRTDDTYVELERRASEANVIDADLFVCVHCNSVINPQANGAEVLVYSRASKSVPFAEGILERLVDLGLRNRGVKERPRLTVLSRTRMPAVLVEPAFISCKRDPDRTLLRTDEGRDKIAEAIVMGIVA
jgi:N-acetylmuramoyl-L-alanine amidase